MTHTTEECARQVLQVFEDFNVRAGQIIMQGSFIKPFTTGPWKMEDFNNGVNEAVRRGWIAVENGGHRFRLTALGASEIA